MRLRPPRVLTAVLTYNSAAVVGETLRALLAQDYPRLDLVVMDNQSGDGTAGLVREAFPDIRLIESGANLGYCGGNNLALDMAARGDYGMVVAANPDVELEPTAIRSLVETARGEERAGLVGGHEVDHSTGRTRTLGARGISLGAGRAGWLKEVPPGCPPGRPFRVDCVQGALVLLTRAALDAGIRFNEDLFAYVDEIDLGLQVARAGLHAYVDPRVEVRHKVRHGSLSPTEGYLILRNRWYVARRWGRWHQRAACLLSLGIGDLPYRYLRRSLQGHRRYARACALGLWDGLRGVTGPGRVGRL